MEEKKRETSLRGKKVLSSLKALAQKSLEQSKVRGEQVREKRKSKPEKKLPDFSVCDNGGQKKEKVVNSNTVREWFRDGIERNYSGKIKNPFESVEWKTRGKQGSLAKKLLEEYGDELVERAVAYLCDNWEHIVANSGGSVSGIPTVEFLWATRVTVFADVQMGRKVKVHKGKKKSKKHMVGEFSPDHIKDAPGVGW